jgi:hypothetical protein
MILADVPAGEPHPDCAIQPAGSRRQGCQERLGKDQAFACRGDRPKTQFASLISAVQYHSPTKSRPLVPIPIEHPDQLIAQSVDYKWRWHRFGQRIGLPHRRKRAGLPGNYAECGPSELELGARSRELEQGMQSAPSSQPPSS